MDDHSVTCKRTRSSETGRASSRSARCFKPVHLACVMMLSSHAQKKKFNVQSVIIHGFEQLCEITKQNYYLSKKKKKHRFFVMLLYCSSILCRGCGILLHTHDIPVALVHVCVATQHTQHDTYLNNEWKQTKRNPNVPQRCNIPLVHDEPRRVQTPKKM